MMYNEVYNEWCNNVYFDEATRNELKGLAGNNDEIRDKVL